MTDFRKYIESGELPDIGTMESWYRVLRTSTPQAGWPIFQIEYNEFFEVFERVQDTACTMRLDAIREDYRKAVASNLQGRSHKEFREQGYYWHSLWKEGIDDEPLFMELYVQDAREVVDKCLELLGRGNGDGLWMTTDFWADYVLMAFVGLLFYDSEEQRKVVVAHARRLLPEIEEERLKAHVLVHLFHLTREEPLMKEAERIMEAWGGDSDICEEDARLRDFSKGVI